MKICPSSLGYNGRDARKAGGVEGFVEKVEGSRESQGEISNTVIIILFFIFSLSLLSFYLIIIIYKYKCRRKKFMVTIVMCDKNFKIEL